MDTLEGSNANDPGGPSWPLLQQNKKSKNDLFFILLRQTKKKDEILPSLFICSQREHVCSLCITVWKDYRHGQIYHFFIMCFF